MCVCYCRGYTGNEHSSNSMAKSEETTTRYELQTRDGRRISSNSASSPTAQYSSKTLPATTKLHLASGSNNTPHSPSMDAIYPHTSHKPSLLHAHSASPPHHMMPSARQDDIFRLQGIPEHHTQGQGVHTSHCVVSSRAGSLPYSSTSDGFNTDMIPDPTSLYDVPSNALLVGSSPVNMPSSPQSSHLLYDVPKDVLIATGHYKVPSLSLNDPNTPLTPEGVYDVPSSAIYDIPPDVYHHYYNQQDLYDVPPNSIITRPRLNSQPTSQKELFEARRSITDNPSGPDNVFTTTADVVRDYSHYDVPRSLVMIEDGNISQPSQQQGELDQFGKRLSRRNSIPIHAMLYDVPRNALLADNEAMNLSRPPTAPKPTRGRKTSRSHSISSTHDYRSPEHTKPHKNAAFYKVAPLDPELLTKHKKESTSGEQEAAHMRSHHLKQHSVPTTYSNNTVKQQTHTIAVSPRRSTSFKKNKVPPPTKIKPGRGGEV